jgi:hypothetical protein
VVLLIAGFWWTRGAGGVPGASTIPPTKNSRNTRRSVIGCRKLALRGQTIERTRSSKRGARSERTGSAGTFDACPVADHAHDDKQTGHELRQLDVAERDRLPGGPTAGERADLANGSPSCIAPVADTANSWLAGNTEDGVPGVLYAGPSASYTLTQAQRNEAITLKKKLAKYNSTAECP